MPRTEAEAYDEVAQKVIASYTESVQAALRRHFVAAERERIAREVEAWSAPSGLMGDFYVTKSAVLAIVNPEGEG